MTKRLCVLMLAALIPLLAGCSEPPTAGPSLADAKRLVEIGAYAQALPILRDLAEAEPENVEVRLLMARSFAECGLALEVPGLQSVGKSNAERAIYQLQVVAKLGDAGKAALREAIADVDSPLALPAIEAAGAAGTKGLTDVIGAYLKRCDQGGGSEKKVIEALVKIGGNEAADVIKELMKNTFDRRRKSDLAGKCASCYDPEGLIKQAGETTDQGLLNAIVQRARRTRVAEEVLTVVTERDFSGSKSLERVKGSATSELQQVAPEKVLKPLVELCVGASEAVVRNNLERIRRALDTIADRNSKRYVELLEELSKAKAPAVRQHAASRLVEVAPEKAVAPLCVALKTPEESSKVLAMLRRTKSRKALPALLELMEAKSDPKRTEKWPVQRWDVCCAIIECQANGEELVRTLRLLEKPHPTERRRRSELESFFNLVKEKNTKGLEEFVAVLLVDKEENYRRYGAALGLPRVLMAGRVRLALNATHNADSTIRMCALQVIRDGDLVEAIKIDELAKLLDSEHKDVMREAANLLSRKPPEVVSKHLFDLLKDSKRAKYVMPELATFFEKSPDKRAADAFVWEIVSSAPTASIDTLAKAVKACSADLTASAKEIARALQDESLSVRINAAKALEVLKDKAVLPDLYKALGKTTSSREKNLLSRLIRTLGGDPSNPPDGPSKVKADGA